MSAANGGPGRDRGRTAFVRRLACLGAALAVLAGAGCSGDDATGPEPGTLALTLASPHADDAALVVSVNGPGIEAVEAATDRVYIHVVDEGTARTVVVVAEALAPGVILRVSVPDIGAVDGYTATLLQAADTANALRASLDGYSLTIGVPGG